MKKRIILQLKKVYRFLKRLNMTLECNKTINPIYKSTEAVLDIKHPSIKETKRYWRKYGIRINPKWHAFCAALNNIHSSKYVPADVFFNYIMPSLNNFNLVPAYKDKNMYDVFMQGIKMPKTILRCMHGNLHDADYNLLNVESYQKNLPCEDTDCLIKPTIDSGGGKNIKNCKIKHGIIFVDEVLQDINELISSYSGDFIIQKGIEQSSMLSDIYSFSVNSVRSISVRYENKIVVLSNQLLFGNNQKYTSNTGSGGVVCGVNHKGMMTEFCYDSKFSKMFEHPFTQKTFKNLILPNFSAFEKTIIQCHERLPHFDFVAWDFGLDNLNQYVLIEYNLSSPGLNYNQVFDGPIFENYLDKILSNIHKQ